MNTDKTETTDTFAPTPTPITDEMRNSLAFMAKSLEDRCEGHLGDHDMNADRAMLLRVIGMTTDVESIECSAAFLHEELADAKARMAAGKKDPKANLPQGSVDAGQSREKAAAVVVPMKRRAGKAGAR